MGTLKLNTTSGGSLSIQAADGASDNTLTIPSATGNILTDSSALPALDGSALTNLPASSLTGALPALDGSALTNLPAPAALSTASGSAPSYSARAWVNFNGTGTVAIRDSENVTSITDQGTGDYFVNFTTNMQSSGHSYVGCCNEEGGIPHFCNPTQGTSSGFRIRTYVGTTNAAADVSIVNFATFD